MTPVSPVTGHPVPGGPVTGPPVTGPVTGGPVTGGPVAPTTLVTRTVALETSVDLAAVAGDHGVLWIRPGAVSLAGRGAAARVSVCLGDGRGGRAGEDVAAVLAAIEWDGPHPPVAMGALPFARSGRAEMVVPAVLVRRQADGSHWLTVTSPDPGPDVDEIRRRLVATPPSTEGPGPREFRVRSEIDRDAWCRLVGDAAAAVAAGRLDKVVLARAVTVVADRPFRPADVAGRLMASHPSCMVFSMAGFVGASPELLVDRHGEQVLSQPLAGTAARTGPGGGDDELAPRLLSSAKERGEHRLVVDAVSAALARYCDELSVPPVPALVPLGTLAHLGTLIVGRLRRPLPTALDLVGAVHPSPAVGGTPTDAALDYIDEVEGLERGRYAGPVGWVDGNGDGCFALGLRSAQIEGRRARLMAGVGVVAGSDPVAELAETDLKLQPMLAALVRP
ncbi:MAG TPA: isochorismate synthase [Acidimicrobiales bacterium]|nr:isochorismate synthase [Acidimicrobiales bacterium]